LNDGAEIGCYLPVLEQRLQGETMRYVEVRPHHPLPFSTGLCRATQTYCLHTLDLRPDLPTLFANCHKSSTQRKIRRAEQRLTYDSGQSPALLDIFWDLLLLTRRRHHVPPQPKAWFRNLIACLGDRLQIRVAFHDKLPVASILTIRHRNTLVYKYGCSDARYHHLGGTHLLFWKSIEESKRNSLDTLDLGRTDLENEGLLTFKDRWGATRSPLVYSRFSSSPPPATSAPWIARLGRAAIPHLPACVLRTAGRLLYKHIG
jgi:lipid II:glycine glycyltransferase (peptidoglycan interpeptide bridge formation enzyme)